MPRAPILRREFLRNAAAFGAASMLGCHQGGTSDLPVIDVSDDGELTPVCGADAAAETELSPLPFEGETGPFGVAQGAGLDGRLYTDLALLDEEHLITDNDSFYIRTRYPALLDPAAPWVITLDGLVEAPAELSLEDLLALERDQGTLLLECSGNFRSRGFGLMSAATWQGVPLLEVMERVQRAPGAARVLVTGSDAHASESSLSQTGASWILSIEQIEQAGSFLATRMNGVALPLDHGYPVRLINPGWYGCSCIKWVQRLSWVADDAPSTSQMIEFSSRTHQIGEPALARDYASPEIQQSAMPIRVEKRRGPGGVCYRVVGIVWGGQVPVARLALSIDGGGSYRAFPISVATNRTWSLWSIDWAPPAPGRYELVCRIEEPEVPMRRLDSSYYSRSVQIDDV